MKNSKEDISGLYEASGLKAAIEEAERMKEEEKRKNEEDFWKNTENKSKEQDIDPFWLS